MKIKHLVLAYLLFIPTKNIHAESSYSFNLQSIFYKKQTPSLLYQKRTGLLLSVESQISSVKIGLKNYFLPDFYKKSQELTYDQDIYGFFFFMGYPIQLFFTVIPEISMGAQWSRTLIKIDQVNTKIENITPASEISLSLYYPLTERFSFSYRLFTIYDFFYRKTDWGHGGGITYVF